VGVHFRDTLDHLCMMCTASYFFSLRGRLEAVGRYCLRCTCP
jgi:hypothetical protein